MAKGKQREVAHESSDSGFESESASGEESEEVEATVESEGESWAIVNIVSHRGKGPKLEYLIKWYGNWPDSYLSAKDCDGCEDALADYWRAKGSKAFDIAHNVPRKPAPRKSAASSRQPRASTSSARQPTPLISTPVSTTSYTSQPLQTPIPSFALPPLGPRQLPFAEPPSKRRRMSPSSAHKDASKVAVGSTTAMGEPTATFAGTLEQMRVDVEPRVEHHGEKIIESSAVESVPSISAAESPPFIPQTPNISLPPPTPFNDPILVLPANVLRLESPSLPTDNQLSSVTPIALVPDTTTSRDPSLIHSPSVSSTFSALALPDDESVPSFSTWIQEEKNASDEALDDGDNTEFQVNTFPSTFTMTNTEDSASITNIEGSALPSRTEDSFPLSPRLNALPLSEEPYLPVLPPQSFISETSPTMDELAKTYLSSSPTIVKSHGDDELDLDTNRRFGEEVLFFGTRTEDESGLVTGGTSKEAADDHDETMDVEMVEQSTRSPELTLTPQGQEGSGSQQEEKSEMLVEKAAGAISAEELVATPTAVSIERVENAEKVDDLGITPEPPFTQSLEEDTPAATADLSPCEPIDTPAVNVSPVSAPLPLS
ncbi:hypothetical protein P7C70_g5647, partial [Phenoliferia sp. Uapishka_3]